MRKKIPFHRLDKVLLSAPIVILCIGFFAVHSASFKLQQTIGECLVSRQLMWALVGALLVLLILRQDYFRLMDFAWPFYLLNLILLAAVFFAPSRLGAHRWLGVGGFNIQPSELAKLSVILVLSRYFATNRIEYLAASKKCLPFIIVAVPFFLILREPDLGTGLILIPIFFAMLYLWGFSPKWILAMILGGVCFLPFMMGFLKEYQRARFFVFLNPNLDPLGAGYTITQSKIAIGSGGWLGKGFMAGTQNYLKFLPERHTDFIFGVVGEEGGFIISMILLCLYWLVIAKGYRIASQTSDRFGAQLACGITTMIAVQVFINLGMTMGVLPVVGVPLPLVSYGGTSVAITLAAIGILLSVKIYRSSL